MEPLEEFLCKNPDVPTKLTITAIAFFSIALILTGASILSSLALTFVYLFAHGSILYVTRNLNLIKVNDNDRNIQESGDFIDVDTDEEDSAEYDLIVPQGIEEEKILRARKHFHLSPVDVNYYKLRNAIAAKPSSTKPYKVLKSVKERNFIPVAKNQDFTLSKPMRMNQSRHSDTFLGLMSPERQHILGIDQWKLSRQPLRPTVRNIPSTAKSGKYTADKKFNISKPSHHKTNVVLNGPQTSSPFHEQSPVGLWDTMSLSAIAGSPNGYLSPITSPSKENDTLNQSSQQIFVDVPSPDKGLGLSHRNYPLHTTGHPVDSKRHLQMQSVTSYWQRSSQKKQTALHITGRPKLQSPVTVRIAHPPNSHVTPESRNRRRPFINQDPGDSLRKDVILSALREKRKRGKAGEGEEDRGEEKSSSFQEENYEGASHLKKRRLDSYGETKRIGRQSKVRTSRYTSAKTPSEMVTEEEMETGSADNTLEQTCGKSSFQRNAIISSLSSSKKWKDSNGKRSLQSDEEEKLPKLPPKKVTRGTDVSDLEPKESKGREESDQAKSLEKGASSKEDENSERQEHEKTVLSPRIRKRAVFAALHRGKQAKPPSPEQITAADLHEDRQRALERIQQMRLLLRDEEGTIKEIPKEADTPLLPAAKPPQLGGNPLSSTSAVTPVSSLTEVDGSTKPLEGNSGSNTLMKPFPLGGSLFDKSRKENPVSFGLSGQTKEETAKSSSGGPSVSFGLSKTSGIVAPSNTLSVAVSNPPASSKPSSLLQALSNMQKSVEADTKRVSSPSSGGQTNLQGNPATSSTAAPTPSSSSLPLLTISSISATNTATAPTISKAAPAVGFGSGSTGLVKDSQNTNALSTSTAQPTFLFGTGNSTSNTSSTGPVTQTQTSTPSMFGFGSGAPPPYGSSHSTAAKTVTSFTTPVSNTQVTVQSNFMFGSAPAVTQSGIISSGLTFNKNNASSSSTVSTSATGTFSFGAAKQTPPTFSFGQPGMKSQQTAQSPAFGFSSGSATATTVQQTSTTSTPAQFSFGAAPVSKTTTTASSSLFQMPTQTTSTTASSGATSSPFVFGGAKAPTASSSGATNAPSPFSFGQANPGSGFTFGNQQSKPSSQSSLFPSNQSSSQPTGFSFGNQSQKPASQGSLFSSGQGQKQTGFTFGSQSSQGAAQTQLFPSAQQSQSTSMFGSASTPALNFGTQAASTPSSMFPFGGSIGATQAQQQQSTPGFNFQSTPSTNFSLGGATSVPAFGQGQQATPPRQGGGFSIGSTNGPRKTSSARMRQRQRAGRR